MRGWISERVTLFLAQMICGGGGGGKDMRGSLATRTGKGGGGGWVRRTGRCTFAVFDVQLDWRRC